MRRWRWLALAFALAAAMSGCGGKGAATEEKAEKEAPAADSNLVALTPAAAESAGITIATAGAATIDVTVDLPGEVKADSSRVQTLRPRFAGMVHHLPKRLGDTVHRGETVATIQSNESLTDYAVTAAIPGRVVTRGATEGQAVTTDTPLYTIVDLSDVWIEFAIYPHQLGSIRTGQTVLIAPPSGSGPRARSTIAYVGPLVQEDTHASTGRVVLANSHGEWQPGQFVTVSVVTDHAAAAIAVPDDAIVRMAGGAAVFVAEARGFRLTSVVAGRTDGRTTEIVQGLADGARVAAHNAFVLKAELEKGAYEE